MAEPEPLSWHPLEESGFPGRRDLARSQFWLANRIGKGAPWQAPAAPQRGIPETPRGTKTEKSCGGRTFAKCFARRAAYQNRRECAALERGVVVRRGCTEEGRLLSHPS